MKNVKEVRDLLAKIISEGNHKSGEYKGFKWSIERIPHSGHLCGYIHFDEKATTEQFDIMDKHFHGGVTWGLDNQPKDGRYGFDCIHGCDLAPYELFTDMHTDIETYRTMQYVEDVLKDTIDAFNTIKKDD